MPLLPFWHRTVFEAPYLAGGSIAFDEYGQNTVPGCILRLTDGELLLDYQMTAVQPQQTAPAAKPGPQTAPAADPNSKPAAQKN